MNILRRRVRAMKEAAKEGTAEATVSRRIEITVERETVTVLVRGQPAMSKQEAESKTAEDQAGQLQVPLPAPVDEDKVKKSS